MPPRSAVAPFRKLPDACFEHLIGMEARVLAQKRAPEGRDEILRRVSDGKMTRNEAGGGIDLPLAIEDVEQSGRKGFRFCREIVQRIALLARQARRRGGRMAGRVYGH